jgi:hypothetical protein
MKLTFLSKTLGTIGLIAVLSTIVGTSVQKTAEAQTEAQTEEQAVVDQPEKFCNQTFPQDHPYFYTEGVDFSAEQMEAFNVITAAFDEKAAIIRNSAQEVIDPDAPVYFVPLEGLNLTLEEMTELMEVTGTVALSATPDQVDALNEQFGQYGEFGASPTLVTTPEQDRQIEANDQESIVQILAILTPEQQAKFRENLALQAQNKISTGCESISPIARFQMFQPRYAWGEDGIPEWSK